MTADVAYLSTMRTGQGYAPGEDEYDRSAYGCDKVRVDVFHSSLGKDGGQCGK